ncbi:hypothetical protein [Paraflavitalea speifideaquila]|uniref:hypothetical protein n=1 Tax=Paraflavitalea speifideaquila TaxID=3076558 RepID=UPI0028E995F6|nr:hypothetical protein [Paraflavitalea speifideiaquila]
MVVSDWVAFEKKGLVLAVDPATKNVTTINQELIAGPADFALTPNGELVVPAMLEAGILQYVYKPKNLKKTAAGK